MTLLEKYDELMRKVAYDLRRSANLGQPLAEYGEEAEAFRLLLSEVEATEE